MLSAGSNSGWTWHLRGRHAEPLAIVRNDDAALPRRWGTSSGIHTPRAHHGSLPQMRWQLAVVGDAYRSIAESAMQRQVYFQPVIARYSLIGGHR